MSASGHAQKSAVNAARRSLKSERNSQARAAKDSTPRTAARDMRKSGRHPASDATLGLLAGEHKIPHVSSSDFLSRISDQDQMAGNVVYLAPPNGRGNAIQRRHSETRAPAAIEAQRKERAALANALQAGKLAHTVSGGKLGTWNDVEGRVTGKRDDLNMANLVGGLRLESDGRLIAEYIQKLSVEAIVKGKHEAKVKTSHNSNHAFSSLNVSGKLSHFSSATCADRVNNAMHTPSASDAPHTPRDEDLTEHLATATAKNAETATTADPSNEAITRTTPSYHIAGPSAATTSNSAPLQDVYASYATSKSVVASDNVWGTDAPWSQQYVYAASTGVPTDSLKVTSASASESASGLEKAMSAYIPQLPISQSPGASAEVVSQASQKQYNFAPTADIIRAWEIAGKTPNAANWISAWDPAELSTPREEILMQTQPMTALTEPESAQYKMQPLTPRQEAYVTRYKELLATARYEMEKSNQHMSQVATKAASYRSQLRTLLKDHEELSTSTVTLKHQADTKTVEVEQLRDAVEEKESLVS